MKDYLVKLSSQGEQAKTSAEELFFTENNVNGYFSTGDFTTYFNASSDSERNHLDQVFDLMAEGASLNGVIKPVFDNLAGHEVIWLHPKLPKATFKPLRVLHDARLLRFFQSYQKGEFASKIRLQGLLIKAGFDI